MPYRMLVVLSTLVCLPCWGCSSGPSAQVVRASEQLRSEGIPYADLFVMNNQWNYEATREAGFWDDSHPDADANGEVNTTTTWRFSCRVDDVRAFSGGSLVSRFDCDGEDEGTLEGVYTHSGGQLWSLADWPDTEDELIEMRSDKPIIGAHPQPVDRFREDETGGGEMIMIERDGEGGWCAGEAYWGGDEMSRAVCVAPGRGITSYSRSWAGGSWEEVIVDQVE